MTISKARARDMTRMPSTKVTAYREVERRRGGEEQMNR
jgi:hypothetical protein